MVSGRSVSKGVPMTKTELLNKCARDPEQRVLLARVLDRLEQAQNRGIPAHTQFLSPGEQAAVTDLLNTCGHPRHLFFGGFEGAERQICVFLPDWQEQEDWLACGEEAVCALRAGFPKDADLSHRDILGSLMGLGITREKLGDIVIDDTGCFVLVMSDAVGILLSQWDSAGRARLNVKRVSLGDISVAPPQVRTIRDTVSTLRLDAVVACGFSTSRGKAADLIGAGRVMVNHRECMKADVLTCRGLGKCVLTEVGGLSRKGRITLTIECYI